MAQENTCYVYIYILIGYRLGIVGIQTLSNQYYKVTLQQSALGDAEKQFTLKWDISYFLIHIVY